MFPDSCGEIEWLDNMRFHIPTDVPCAVMFGSVGQPLHETDLRAAWVLWDPVARVVEFRKTEYDRLQAAQNIVNAGLPLESAGHLLNRQPTLRAFRMLASIDFSRNPKILRHRLPPI